MITLIEGDSTAPNIVGQVEALLPSGARTLIFLDSNHSKAHVAAELEAYHPFVSEGSYIVATDGFMSELTDVPRGDANWKDDHPTAAAHEFVSRHPEFAMTQPPWPFNESELGANVTHWPGAWLQRLRASDC
jgi:cephalosporin hydroxylase